MRAQTEQAAADPQGVIGNIPRIVRGEGRTAAAQAARRQQPAVMRVQLGTADHPAVARRKHLHIRMKGLRAMQRRVADRIVYPARKGAAQDGRQIPGGQKRRFYFALHRPPRISLIVFQAVDRIESGGLSCGIYTKNNTNDRAEKQG